MFFIFQIFVFPARAEITTTELSNAAVNEIKGLYSENWLRNINNARQNISDKYGTSFAFVLNYTQQLIVNDKNYAGHSSGLWYANLAFTQRLWDNALATLEFEVDKNKGVDKLISTYSEFNNNTGKNASLYIPAFYIEQNAFQNKLYWVAGKTDLSNWFDLNEAANSADIQFLSSALINSYTIPFSSNGPAIMAKFSPSKNFYFQSGVSSANAVSTKVGLNDAFASSLFLNEFGFSSNFSGLKGNYRFIYYWLRKKSALIMDDVQEKKGEGGFSLSFDQAITQKITMFLRYGFDDPKLNDIEYSWSGGFQINKPFESRKNDYFGFGVAQSIFGRDYRHWYNDSNELGLSSRETIIEAFYNFSFNDYIYLSPDLQAVVNPNGNKKIKTPVVASLRLLMVF